MVSKKKRVRGLILSLSGWQKVQDAKLEWEYREKQGYKVTLEEIGEKAGLTTATIRKILIRDEGVDKRSLVTFFLALDLELNPEDYSKPNPKGNLNSDEKVERRTDWGEAVDVSVFYGRILELATLERWSIEARCRLIAVIGMGGLGKTAISVKFAQQVENKFERVVWRSLRDAPDLESILTNLIQFLATQPIATNDLPQSISEKISLLIDCLRESRCLVVLDNIESLLCDESRAGICREEHQQYGELFRRVGEASHQSCLLLTTREKPKEIALLSGKSAPVRSLQLSGFKEIEGKKILKQKGLNGTEAQLSSLVRYYNGNPLALKIAATTIRDLFLGNISEFLAQDTAIFGDIHDVLEQQFQRLLDMERKILYWLAINREPVELDRLKEDLIDSVTKLQLLDGLESLSRRCLIEKVELAIAETSSVCFTLQSVVMEYVTNQLVKNVSQEIITQNIELFRYYALLKATAKDYIKETQIRLIIKPIVTKLFDQLGSQSNIEKQLLQIKTTIQETSPRQRGYVAGNILNLLYYLGTDLRTADFSNLCIWQADLQNICLHDVSFQNCDLSKTIFSETFSGIVSVAFSRDGKILAAGDSNGEIHLWRIADNQPLKIFRGHTSWVTSLNFSPDDKLLLSGSSDSDVRLWNIETGECLKTLEEHQGEVWAVVFSPDGKILVSGSDDHTIRLWQTATGECLNVFQGHISWVTSLAFNSDGTTLASGSDDRTIIFWDFSTGQCLKVLQGHEDGVRSIAFFPNDQILASSSDDYTIKLWNVSTGECIRTLDGHSNQIFSIAVSPKGEYIASGCHDHTIKLWDISTGECIKTFQEHDNWVLEVAFHPKGNLLASGSRDQTVRLWNVNQSKCIKTFQGYTNQIFSVCFSPDEGILASGSQDRTVRLWNVNTGECIKTLQGHNNWVYSVAFSHQGNLLVSGSADKTVKIWDVNTGQCLRTLKGHSASVKSVAFRADDSILASSSEDSTIMLWDVNTGQITQVLKEHQATVWSIVFSPDGKILATGSLDRTIKLWDSNTGKCLKTLIGHDTWVWSVSFSPNGKILASSTCAGDLKFWNIEIGECHKSISPSTGWLLSTAFCNDGKLFAASSQDCTIKLWNIQSYDLVRTLSGHKNGYIWSVVFGSNTPILASGGEDESVKLWNIETGECCQTFKPDSLYKSLNFAKASGLSEPTILSLRALGAAT